MVDTSGATAKVTPRRSKSKKPIHIQRIKNLQTLIEKRFDGNATACAKKIERTHTFIWQLVNGYRSIGENTARHIEMMLELQPNAMDAKGTCDRSEYLIATMPDGSTREYVMCPLLDLDHLAAKPLEWFPFPIHNAGRGSFCVSADTGAVRGLRRGDLAFADPSRTELCHECLFVVKMAAWEGAAGLLVAMKHAGKRWTFESQPAARQTDVKRAQMTETYKQKDVEVIARVTAIVRKL